MADTSVGITPGTGALVDARSQPGGDIRQVVTIGDGDATPIAPVDASGLHVHSGKATTATLSNVAASATSAQLLAATAARLGLIVYNDSAADLYLKFGTTASTTSFTDLIPAFARASYPDAGAPVYTGRIDGIWSSATGNARITELT